MKTEKIRTNSNKVKKKVQKHIKKYFTKKELKEQIDSMIYSHISVNSVALEMVKGGYFLIYNEEVKDFLNGLGINPNNKEYENTKSWELYCKLMAYNIEKIYNNNEVK